MADNELRNAGDAARAGEVAVKSYREQATSLRAENGEVRRQIGVVTGQLDGLYEGLVASAFGDVSAASVARASAIFGAARLPSLFDEMTREIERQVARCAAAASDPRFVRADAELRASSLRFETISEELAALRHELAAFENDDDFMLLSGARTVVIVPAASLAWVVFRNVFLLGFLWSPLVARYQERERKARTARVLDAFENTVLDAVYERFDALPGLIRVVETKQNTAIASQREIRALVREHAEGSAEIQRLQELLPARIRRTFLEYLRTVAHPAWTEIRTRVPDALRLTVTTICALKEKARSLEQMGEYLAKEARDRDSRLANLQQAVAGWRRRPSRTLSKDMTAALVTAPAQFARATTARVAGVHVMSQAVYGYADYALYDMMLLQHHQFLFWDLAAHHCHGPFPGLSFQHAVLPDVCGYHEQNPQAADALAELPPVEAAPDLEAVGLAGGFDAATTDEVVAATDMSFANDPATFEDPASFDALETDFSSADTDYGDADSRTGGSGWSGSDASYDPAPSHSGWSSPDPSPSHSDPSSSYSDPSPSYDSGSSDSGGGGGFD